MGQRTFIVAESWITKGSYAIWLTFGDSLGHGQFKLEQEWKPFKEAFELASRMSACDGLSVPPYAMRMFGKGWKDAA
jgi:hypothetical protein